jgi:elongation factor 1-beta
MLSILLLLFSRFLFESHQLTQTQLLAIAADVKVFQQIKQIPAPEKYPYAWRWYNHLLTFEGEFDSLPGDPTKEFTAYGPESSELTLNPAKAPEKAAEEDDDEVDLFGSDDDEVDEEAEKLKAERLAEYNKKKAGKTKPAAKSIVTLDVKPWGMCSRLNYVDQRC